MLAGDLDPTKYDGLGCFVVIPVACEEAIVVDFTTGVGWFGVPVGQHCKTGFLPTTGMKTFDFQVWSHPDWEATIWNGPTTATATKMATLTPSSPYTTLPMTADTQWWVSVDNATNNLTLLLMIT